MEEGKENIGDSLNLYISGLPKNFHKKDLEALAKPFGEVLSAKIMINLKTSETKGYGFIRIRPLAGARAAANALNGYKIDDHTLICRETDSVEAFGEKSNYIFIRGIKVTTPIYKVRKLFSKFGNIEKVKIKGQKGKPRGFIIRYETIEAAESAIRELNNTKYKGELYPMYIQYWHDLSSSSSSSSPTKSSDSSPYSSPDSTPEKSESTEESQQYEPSDQVGSWAFMLDDL